MSAMLTVNSPFRFTNSLVPSRGSTSQYRPHPALVAKSTSSADSSESTGKAGERASRPSTMVRCEARSASVRGDSSALRATSNGEW